MKGGGLTKNLEVLVTSRPRSGGCNSCKAAAHFLAYDQMQSWNLMVATAPHVSTFCLHDITACDNI